MYHLSSFTPPHLFDDLDDIIREKISEGIEWRCIVLTDSMRYMIRPGNFIIVEKAEIESLRKRDIIIFRSAGGYSAHRIVSIDFDTGTIQTRGDLNYAADPPVSFSRYRGRVRTIKSGQISISRTDLAWYARSIRSLVQSQILRIFLSARGRFQNLVFAAGRLQPAGKCLHVLAGAAICLTAHALRLSARAQCVFARRSFALGEWVPGLSDADLGIVSDSSDAWSRSISLLSAVQKIIPFMGEVWIGTEGDLEFCRHHEYRQLEVHSWKALSGTLPLIDEHDTLHPFKVRIDCLTELREALRYFCASVIRFEGISRLPGLARLTLRKHLLNAAKAVYYLENPPGAQKEYLAGREEFLRYMRDTYAAHQLTHILQRIDEKASGDGASARDFCIGYQEIHGYLHDILPEVYAFFSSEGVEFPLSCESSILHSLDPTWADLSSNAKGAEILEYLEREGRGFSARAGRAPYLLSEIAFRIIAIDSRRSFLWYFTGEKGTDPVRWIWAARVAADALALANRLHAGVSRALKLDCLTVWSEFQSLAWDLLFLKQTEATQNSENEALRSVLSDLPPLHRPCFEMLIGEESPGEESLLHLDSYGRLFSGVLADAFRRSARYCRCHMVEMNDSLQSGQL